MARRPLTALGAPDPESGRVEAALALPGGRALRVAAVHPIPPRTVASARQWRTALRALPGAAAGHVPHVLLGDFNATLDNRELRRLLGRGYVDAADATGQGLRPTFPSGRAIPPIAIDHVLFSRSLRVHALSVHDIRHSDHRALVAELVLAPG
jgi:endonuclease/exonuclease/phosphatase family metal-dependent hydrolase